MTALKSTGRRGAVARLRYRVYDDSGVSSDYVQVFRGRRLLASGTTDFGPAQGGVYFVRWRVPRKAKSGLKFCVRSSDESGNTSERSCAPIKIK